MIQHRPSTFPAPPLRSPRGPGARAAEFFAVCWSVAMSFIVVGYSFGVDNGNHHVYLLDAARVADHSLLSNDFFTANTLQYHVLFTQLTAGLMRLGVLKPAFLLGHIACVLLLHVSWLGIVRRLGGSTVTYMLSVLLFYASASGLGLGVYRFLQDGAFLPSNIAAVLFLAAIFFWLENRVMLCGLCVGVAGAFHLNYAVIAPMAWVVLAAWEWHRGRTRALPPRRYWLAAALAITPCLINIGLAISTKLNYSDRIPLHDFIELYVRFRHPHHYLPSSWGVTLWLCNLWPVPLAVLAWILAPRTIARDRAAIIFALAAALCAIAGVGAGIFFVSETLVQMSLWRFSIFAKLLSCAAAAWLMVDARPQNRRWLMPALLVMGTTLLLGATSPIPVAAIAKFCEENQGMFIGAGLLTMLLVLYLALPSYRTRSIAHGLGIVFPVVAITLAARGYTGLTIMQSRDMEISQIARWALRSTPVDSIFLLPPDDSAFRLEAMRSVVVSFKQVPQLSGELLGWRDRLQNVLAMDDITQIKGMMPTKLAEIHERYRVLTPEHLARVAARYNATYIVTIGEKAMPADAWQELGPISGAGPYHVYARRP